MKETALRLEKKALKQFNYAKKKLFEGQLDEASHEFSRVVSLYPTTHMAMKSHFMNAIIAKIALYSEVLITEAFSVGISSLKTNVIMDLFNKEKQYYVQNYEIHAAKRKKAFLTYKTYMMILMEEEISRKYPIIDMYINIDSKKIKDKDPLGKLDELRLGTILPETELKQLLKDVYFFILITVISDDFDIEYTDELSDLVKDRLNRVDFYHSTMVWFQRFSEFSQDAKITAIIKHCCVVILGLTNDSSNPKRQEAYENLAKLSKDFYSMAVTKEEIEEAEVEDIEGMTYQPQKSAQVKKDSSLIDLVCIDQHSECATNLMPFTSGKILNIEFSLEPSQEMLNAQQELSSEEKQPEKTNTIADMLEFE